MKLTRNLGSIAPACSAGTDQAATGAKRSWRHTASARALLLGLLAVPTGALAQNAEPTILGEVVVTAQKREENLQDVPVAITAFTSELRDATGLVTAQQQMNFTPGVNYYPGADRVTIRGVGRVTTQIGTDQGVAVYQDGFYVGSAAFLSASSLGSDRTEILRGPQGTLYGRNSIGGAINVISRRPDNEFTGEVRAAYNNYNGTTFEGRVSGPVMENLRLSAQFLSFHQEEGPYHNTLPSPTAGSVPGGPNGEGPLLNTATVSPVRLNPDVGDEGAGVGNGWTLNLQAEFEIGEDWEGWVRYVTLDNTTRPRDQVGISPWSNLPLIVPNVFTGYQPDQNPGIRDNRAFFANRATDNRQNDYHQLIGHLTWHGEGFDVKYIGGGWQYENNNIIDGDATGAPNFRFSGLLDPVLRPGAPPTVVVRNDIAYRTNRYWYSQSHEINVTSTTDSPLQWIAGLYYYKEDDTVTFDVPVFDEPALSQTTDYLFAPTNFFTSALQTAIGPVPSGPVSNPENLLYDYYAKVETTSQAVFGQIDYRPNDQWHFIAGLRYSKDEKDGYEDQISNTQIVLGDQATLAVADAVLFATNGTRWPRYPVGHPLAGQFVQDYVFAGCAGAGTPLGDAQGIVPVNEVTATQGPCPGKRELSDSWDAWTGTLGVEYSLNEDTNLYARYTRGYKSGGYNLGTLSPGAIVDSESIDAYEIGWKQNFGRTLQFNAAAYWYDYQDLQSLNGRVAQVDPPIIVNQLVNIEESRSYGFELETRWAPIDNMLILFNYGYLNNEIKTACCFVDSSDPFAQQPGAQPADNAGGQSLAGNTLPGSPEHKFAVAVTYTFNFTPGDLTLSANYDWHDDFYNSLFNNPNWFVEGGGLVGASVTWSSAERNYELIARVSNLLDEDVATAFTTLPPNQNFYQLLSLQPPRQWVLEARYKF